MGDNQSDQTKNESIDNIIDRLTSTHEAERGKLFRYAGSKMSDRSRVKAVSAAIDYFYANRFELQAGLGKAVLLYCGLILAIKNLHYSDIRGLSRKDAEVHVPVMEEIRKNKMEKALKRRKQGKKMCCLAKFMGEILEARNAGCSYQLIADSLKVEHKIQVSKEYLRKVLKKCQQ